MWRHMAVAIVAVVFVASAVRAADQGDGARKPVDRRVFKMALEHRTYSVKNLVPPPVATPGTKLAGIANADRLGIIQRSLPGIAWEVAAHVDSDTALNALLKMDGDAFPVPMLILRDDTLHVVAWPDVHKRVAALLAARQAAKPAGDDKPSFIFYDVRDILGVQGIGGNGDDDDDDDLRARPVPPKPAEREPAAGVNADDDDDDDGDDLVAEPDPKVRLAGMTALCRYLIADRTLADAGTWHPYGTGDLLVEAVPQLHAALMDCLTAMRAASQKQVYVECRLIHATHAFAKERLEVSLDTPVPHFVKERHAWFRAIAPSNDASVMQAPSLLVMDGEDSKISLGQEVKQRNPVTGRDDVEQNVVQATFEPTIAPDQSGVHISGRFHVRTVDAYNPPPKGKGFEVTDIDYPFDLVLPDRGSAVARIERDPRDKDRLRLLLVTTTIMVPKEIEAKVPVW